MSSAANTLPAQPAWRRSSLPIALVGSLLLWASLPNFAVLWFGCEGPALGWLGWIAPIPWLLLVRMSALPGRRPYRALYVAGLAFWLASIYWLCLAHPILSLGWIALSAYLAAYLPIFVGLTRTAVHRYRVPLWLAAPIVWTGLELARAHVLTGFLMASLAHTQVNWTMLIQISDVVGEYGVDFVVMLVAASIANLFPISILPSSSVNDRRRGITLSQLAAVIPAVVVLSATLAYGHWRLVKALDLNATSLSMGPRLALVQGNSSADMKYDNREGRIMPDYMDLSAKAIAKAANVGDGRPVDLVVWPETMFRSPLVTFDPDFELPPSAQTTKEAVVNRYRDVLGAKVAQLGTPIFVGIERYRYTAAASGEMAKPPIAYNSTVLVGRRGEIIGTYDKMHRVMFGEYIPFADWFPFLYGITPLTGGIAAGQEPAALRLDGVYCFSPNICYETAIPHVIRRQVATLENRDEYPNALVNVTNDAWYWGSSELDMHLACGVFRAVESRLPLVIAANGGISAWIDHLGRVRAKSPRQQADFIIADIEPSDIRSYYVRYGDWFSGTCLACCIVFAALGWKAKRDLRKVIETRN